MVVYLSAVSCILGFICLITGMLNMILVYIVDPVRTPDRKEDRKEQLWLNRLLLSTGFLLLVDVGGRPAAGGKF